MGNLKIEKNEIVDPYTIGKMGTSGLRLVQEQYNRPFFLEQFTQGIAEYFKLKLKEKNKKIIVIGGDPREGNNLRVKIISKILVANGFKIKIANNNIASTPAMSLAIRKFNGLAGIILTASHNPFTDVGIKINMDNGAPALQDTIDEIHDFQNRVTEVFTCDFETSKLEKEIEYFDAVKMYGDLLDEIFSFSDMNEKLKKRKISSVFDSMHGAAGPFAQEIFGKRLNVDSKFLRVEPREDLGGYDDNGEPLHPEPDFDYISELIKFNQSDKYDIVSAWDSDVDRRLDGGNNFFIESADEFALFAKYSHLINIENLFEDKIYFCRSTVTANSIDLMENYLKDKFKDKEVKIVETPTGFKWIAELGNWGVEESNGIGNPYLREKDGIFSTVFLLKILLETGKNVKELMELIWEDIGRVYFTRGEVSGSDITEKDKLEKILENSKSVVGNKFGDLILEKALPWDYIHPETGEIAAKNGATLLQFSDGNTVKARFSGTGSSGYTLRIYCSKFDEKYNLKKSKITQPMKDAFNDFLNKSGFDGKGKKFTDSNQPDPYN